MYLRVSGNGCSESRTFSDVNEVVPVFSTLFVRFRLNLAQELHKHLLSDVVIMKIGAVKVMFTCEISGSRRSVEEVCPLTQLVFVVVCRRCGTSCRSRLHGTDRMSWYVGEQLPTGCVTTPKGAGPVLYLTAQENICCPVWSKHDTTQLHVALTSIYKLRKNLRRGSRAFLIGWRKLHWYAYKHKIILHSKCKERISNVYLLRHEGCH